VTRFRRRSKMKKNVAFVSMAVLATTLIISGCSVGGGGSITPEEAKAIAKEAYVYGFPMVMNYKTLYNYVIDTEQGGCNAEC
jgi:hypothetical protein